MHRKAFPSLPARTEDRDIVKEFAGIMNYCTEFTFACNLKQLIFGLFPVNPEIE